MSINHQSFLSGVAEVDDDNEDIQDDETEFSHQSSLQTSAFGKLHFPSSLFERLAF